MWIYWYYLLYENEQLVYSRSRKEQKQESCNGFAHQAIGLRLLTLINKYALREKHVNG